MRAGPMDRRVEFQTSTRSKDDTGNDVDTWSTAFECWAEKAKLSGAEYVAAMETVDEATIKLRIRWRDGVEPGPGIRFVFEGKAWRVHAVEEIDRRVGLFVIGRARSDGLSAEP